MATVYGDMTVPLYAVAPAIEQVLKEDDRIESVTLVCEWQHYGWWCFRNHLFQLSQGLSSVHALH